MGKRITDDMLVPEKLDAQINGHQVEAQVLSQLGANLASLKVDGRELIYFSKERLLREGFYNGCFMMFPTPCRLTGSINSSMCRTPMGSASNLR